MPWMTAANNQFCWFLCAFMCWLRGLFGNENLLISFSTVFCAISLSRNHSNGGFFLMLQRPLSCTTSPRDSTSTSWSARLPSWWATRVRNRYVLFHPCRCLTLKVPEKLQLYGDCMGNEGLRSPFCGWIHAWVPTAHSLREVYVYYVVHICDFGMLRVKVYLYPIKEIFFFFFDMWKGHILEVHCTNIQRKRFIKQWNNTY